jgi:hypothetical protein
MEETPQVATRDFFADISWDKVTYNKIDRNTFERLKAKNDKLYATFLGNEDDYSFYMFKKLSWSEFKDIRAKKLDKDMTHDYILNTCVVWPKMDPITLNTLEAGVALTLVYQILIMSNFFKDPSKALELILEVK